jgi:hypothetical protein
MKNGEQGKPRYVRKIKISGFASPEKERRNEDKKREPLLILTVRGLYHGQVKMEAQDGSVFLCSKESARGTLWGDTVEAQKIGRERVMIRRVIERAHEEIIGVLHGLLDEHLKHKTDAIVLGCTHYSFIKKALEQVAPGVPLLDGNLGTVRQLRRVLEKENLLRPEGEKGSIQLITTGDEHIYLPSMERLLKL